MRASLWIAIMLAAALVLACGDDDEEDLPGSTVTASAQHIGSATATPEPPASTESPTEAPITAPPATATATAQPIAATADFADFREFAVQIDTAIENRDGGFFGGRGIEVEKVCRGDEQLGQCTGELAGTVLRGIPGAAWQSDASGLIPKETFGESLEGWWRSALDTSDQLGSGAPRLIAIAKDSTGVMMSIQSLIAQDASTREIERQMYAFRWLAAGSDWQFVGETAAFFNQGALDWLSGECTPCYEYFEPWE